MTQQIPLNVPEGSPPKFALVSDEDFEYVNQYTWSLTRGGYAIGWVHVPWWKNKVKVLMHRYVLGILDDPIRVVDHINRDRLDNTRDNLRAVLQIENMQNRGIYVTHNGQTRFRGVREANGRFYGSTAIRGQLFRFGPYDDELSAAKSVSAFRAANVSHPSLEDLEFSKDWPIPEPIYTPEIRTLSGNKYIYSEDGRWRVRYKEVNVGIFDTVEKAEDALEHFLETGEVFTYPKAAKLPPPESQYPEIKWWASNGSWVLALKVSGSFSVDFFETEEEAIALLERMHTLDSEELTWDEIEANEIRYRQYGSGVWQLNSGSWVGSFTHQGKHYATRYYQTRNEALLALSFRRLEILPYTTGEDFLATHGQELPTPALEILHQTYAEKRKRAEEARLEREELKQTEYDKFVVEVKQRYAAGETIEQLATDYRKSSTTISSIVYQVKRTKDIQTVRRVDKLYGQGERPTDIAEKLNLSKSVVSNIINRTAKYSCFAMGKNLYKGRQRRQARTDRRERLRQEKLQALSFESDSNTLMVTVLLHGESKGTIKVSEPEEIEWLEEQLTDKFLDVTTGSFEKYIKSISHKPKRNAGLTFEKISRNL